MVLKKTDEQSSTAAVAPYDDYRARARRALGRVRAVLAEERVSFKDLVREWVRDGVARGLVVMGDHGLPVAKESWGYVRRDDGRGTCVADSVAFARDRDDVEVLRALLDNGLRGPMQHDALVELGETLAKPGILNEVWMMNLGLVADAVAYGACTAPLLAMISPLLKKLGALCVEGRAETPWQAALECAIPFGRSGHRAKTPREQVEHVLECVAFYVDADAIPAAFKERAPDHMKAAAKLLRTLRVTTIRADVQPPAGRRGRMLTPWGAVQAFAQCFGIRVPDARQVRRRKSN